MSVSGRYTIRLLSSSLNDDLLSADQVLAHLQEIHDDPSKALNERLLESLDGQATGLL